MVALKANIDQTRRAGELTENEIKKIIDTYFRLKNENRWLYASNMVGELIEDFQKNIDKAC